MALAYHPFAFVRCSLLVSAALPFALACTSDQRTLSRAVPTPSDAGTFGAPVSTGDPAAPAVSSEIPFVVPDALDVQPRNGATFDGSTADRTIAFSGFTAAAGQVVDIEVPRDGGGSLDEASWISIARTTSAMLPTSYADPVATYRYSVTALPVRAGGDAVWRPGGLLRYRAVVVDGPTKTLLPFFEPSPKCEGNVAPTAWKDVIKRCKSPYSPDLGEHAGAGARSAVLVSTGPTPKELSPPPAYLSRAGTISREETALYYQAIDAPPTLSDFQARFDLGAPNELTTTYYNRGDLGVGREMHCAALAAPRSGAACYVKNYGVDAARAPRFGGDAAAALVDAAAKQNSFATVAMVKLGTTFAPPAGNDVQFFVYDAKGSLALAAPLDSTGQNPSIPNNCLNCHGGKHDTKAEKVVGAAFLPFDPQALVFSSAPGLGLADQEQALRQLNSLVRNAGSPPSIVELVDGMYGGTPDQPGVKANSEFIPKGWDEDVEARTVYRDAFKPYCRSCHISQVGDYAFKSFHDFKKENLKIAESVCEKKEMPLAEASLDLFWRSSARAVLIDSLGMSTSCASSPSNGTAGKK